jgi:hypothetical protein
MELPLGEERPLARRRRLSARQADRPGLSADSMQLASPYLRDPEDILQMTPKRRGYMTKINALARAEGRPSLSTMMVVIFRAIPMESLRMSFPFGQQEYLRFSARCIIHEVCAKYASR